MKLIFIVVCCLHASGGFSQLSDSLVHDKAEMLGRFLPVNYGRLSRANNYTAPEEFLRKLDKFRSYAYSAHGNATDLEKKDIDAFSMLVLNQYINEYGIDSVKEDQFFKMLRESKEMDTAVSRKLDSAAKARFVKKMPDEQKQKLESMVLNGWNINDSLLFKSSHSFRNLIETKINTVMEQRFQPGDMSRDQQQVLKQKIVEELISDDFIRGYYGYQIMDELLKSGEDHLLIDSAYRGYMSAAGRGEYKDKLAVIYMNYKTYSNGAEAPGFAYKDINGKTVSLKTLSGKYVYIDVWATWCGPCKGEIPHLTRLEEDYKGRNIHFVSLSIDKMSDKPAWEKYVTSHQLGGIQLMADNDINSDFIRKFNINSIPRFILISPDGKIVEANAKRPSDPTIREDFDRLFN